MNGKIFTPRFVVVISTIFIAAFWRLIPHMPNFTPVAAIALFAGAYVQRKSLAFLIPMLALLISDVFLGFHDTMWAVYLSFAITVSLGMVIRNRKSIVNIALVAVSSSILFFIITNFAAWLSGMMPYPMNFQGLMLCYEAAIPFFRNEIAGTLLYSTVLFGSFYFVEKRLPARA